MDVFLVPVAPDRYELYGEDQEEPQAPAAEGPPPPGFFRRLTLRFREQIAEAERARRQGPRPGDARPSLLGRAKAFFFQAEDGIRDDLVTGVQTCALPI